MEKCEIGWNENAIALRIRFMLQIKQNRLKGRRVKFLHRRNAATNDSCGNIIWTSLFLRSLQNSKMMNDDEYGNGLQTSWTRFCLPFSNICHSFCRSFSACNFQLIKFWLKALALDFSFSVTLMRFRAVKVSEKDVEKETTVVVNLLDKLSRKWSKNEIERSSMIDW